MKKLRCKIPTFLLLLCICLPVLAEEKVADDTELLNELRNLHEAYGYVESASKTPQKVNEAPGIVTVITEEEIINSGARDFIDLLRLVPGFNVASDSENVVGIGIRGNWAQEGKVALLIDGIEMNERRFANLFLGQHYPVDHVKKIEVIRGPGSVMYGGFAKLGVINIITKSANDKQGISLVGRYGQMAHSNGHQVINFYAGSKLTEDMLINVSGKVSKSHRSDQLYHDVYGNSVDLAHTNQNQDVMLNAGFQYQNFSLRFLMDQYKAKTSDRFVPIQDAIARTYKTYAVDVKYQQDLSDALKLNLKFDYYNELPWVSEEFVDGQRRYTSKLLIERYLGAARLDYTYQDILKVNAGVEFSHEDFKNLAGDYDNFHMPGFNLQNLPSYETLTAYLENLIKTPWGNLTLGLRYDKHNIFQANLSPRAIFTDTLGDFHYKLLYNTSFRTPTVGNVSFTTDGILKPERTKSYEIELGYQLTKDLSFKTNAFYSSSKDTLIYGIDPIRTDLLQYYNSSSKIKTVGVETELRWQQQWGYVTFNHSYSQMIKNFKDYQPINTLTNSVVNSDMSLAFPAHKFTFNSHIELTPSLSVNPSMIISTRRYGYNAIDENANLLLHKYGAEVLGNLYFRYKDVLVKDLELGFGVYDLFGAKHKFIQPYNSGHAPLPDRSREFIFKVSYQL